MALSYFGDVKTIDTSLFKNTAQLRPASYYPGDYRFVAAPKLLMVWSRLFQALISQAGTYLLTQKFHDGHFAIYKCEGGCRILGVGDLVLRRQHCNWDYAIRSKAADKHQTQMANLISDVVLARNPVDPIESMFTTAAKSVGCSVGDLKKAVEACTGDNPFGGDSLTSFFDWNPFSKKPLDRDYLRFCLVTFEKWTDDAVDQKYADEDLAERLMSRINAAGDIPVVCVAPERQNGDLKFWVNSGRTTAIDGWKTEAELNAYLTGVEVKTEVSK